MNALPAVAAKSVYAERFILGELIGRGTSAKVYRALDLVTRSEVAIKILDPFLSQDETTIERFRLEFRTLRSIRHTNVVRVYDFVASADQYAIVLELVHGTNAQDHVRTHGPLPAADFTRAALALADALRACHRAGVLHRDIKPRNLLVDPAGRFLLTDFGVARVARMSALTMTGSRVGTPEYMSPEQLRGQRLDQRCDVYSFGATCYELLTGRPPFMASSMPEVQRHHAAGPPMPPSAHRAAVPEWLDHFVLRCLAFDPDQRPQGFGEIISLIEASGPGTVEDAAAICTHCRQSLCAIIPFCTGCGRTAATGIAAGEHDLILTKSRNWRATHEYMVGIANPRRPAGWVGYMISPPLVLLSRIAEVDARRIALEMAVLGCESRIVRSRARESPVPPMLLPVAVVGIVGIYWLGTTFTGRVFATASVIGGLTLLAWALTRPLYFSRSDTAPCSSNASVDSCRSPLLEISEPSLRRIAGKLVVALARFIDTLPRGFDQAASDAARVAVLEALSQLRRMEGDLVYLQGCLRVDLQQQFDATEYRIDRERDPLKLAALIEEKASLRRDLDNYRAIDDAFQRRYTAALNLLDVLAEYTHAPFNSRAPLVAEIARVQQVAASDVEGNPQP